MDKFSFIFVSLIFATYEYQNVLCMNLLYMEDVCSASTKSIDVYDHIRLKLTRHVMYLPKFRCQVTLRTNPGDYIWIGFEELSIESICNNDWLELDDGPSRSYPYISGSKFCGYSTPRGSYKTSGNFLTVYFESDLSIEGTGFDLIIEPSITKYMENYCDSDISISGIDQIRLKLTKNQTYQPHFSCKVTITTAFRKKMMFYFRELRTEGSGTCYNDWLEIHDGPSDTGPNLAGGRLCGHSPPSGVYTSSLRHITLYFESDSTIQESGFDMIITAFRYGYCGRDYICDNDRCIYASLICNGYDSCGDHSDCKTRRCRGDEIECKNGRCIPSNSTCDGPNICGDFSDCMTTIPSRTTRLVYFPPEHAHGSSMSVGTIIGIAVSCVLTLAFLIVGITAYCIKKSRYRDPLRYEPDVSTVNSAGYMRYAYNNPLLYSDPPPPYPGITNSTVTNQLTPPPYTAEPLMNQETRSPYPNSSTTPTVNQATQSPYRSTSTTPTTNQGTVTK